MERRSFLSLAAAGLQTARRASKREYGYVEWNWERWRDMTGESRPGLATEQTGKGELIDLLKQDGKPVATPAAWQARSKSIRAAVSAILGDSPSSKPPLAMQLSPEIAADSYTRRRIVFQTEPGENVPGWLLVPKARQGRLPAVVCPHQTVQNGKDEPAGLAGDQRLHMAAHLAARGYVTLSYDALCFGERHKTNTGHYGDAIPFYKKHPHWSLMSKMAWDLSRAVDCLASLDFVDPKRIGSIGHSHGGYTTIFAMALDPRLAAGVSSCGFDTFRIDGNTWRWSRATALMPRLGFYISNPHLNMENYRAMPDSGVVETPFDMHEVLALIAPRPLFLSTSDEDAIFPNAGWSARRAIARVGPVYKLLGAEGRLGSYFFEGGHSFPPEARERAYGWLDRWLKG